MPRQLVECVPNFSEGRDAGKIDAIVQSILDVPEVVLLDRESDAVSPRSLYVFVAKVEAVRVGVDLERGSRASGRFEHRVEVDVHRIPTSDLACGGMPDHVDVGVLHRPDHPSGHRVARLIEV